MGIRVGFFEGIGWLLMAADFVLTRVLDALPCSENDFGLEHEYQSLFEIPFALQVKLPAG